MKLLLDKIRLPEADLRATIDDEKLDELADSLRDIGLLQPIGVKAIADGEFEVIFGARRTRAAKMCGWTEIEANIIESEDNESHDAKKLIENVQRENLTPIEEAYGLFALVGEDEPDIRKLQRQTGKSRPWIKSRMELLILPDDCQQAIQAGLVAVGVAKALGGIENQTVRTSYLRYAIDQGCTTETAISWANQAEFAEIGILSMEQHEQTERNRTEAPEFIEQLWSCFCCKVAKNHRNISMFSICRTCMEDINPQKDSPQYTAPPVPLDTRDSVE